MDKQELFQSIQSFSSLLSPEEGTEFYSWEYDDGTEAGVAIDLKSEKEIYAKVFQNREQRKAFQKGISENSKKKKLEFEKNKLTLYCGLPQANLRNYQIKKGSEQHKEISQAGREHFLRMLESCGQDIKARTEVLNLVSALLAAYYYRCLVHSNLLPTEDKLKLHAPILACNFTDGVNDWLECIVTSIGIDTTVPVGNKQFGTLSYHQPNCLPESLTDKHIEDCAYIKLRKGPKKYFDTSYPAQYRDTPVFLNARFFSKQELLQFQQRNPWAVLVFLDIRDQCLITDPIRLDGKILANNICEDFWDVKIVHRLVGGFLNWLQPRLHEEDTAAVFQEKIQMLDRLIAQHNRQRGSIKIRGLKKLWLEIQMLALSEFSTFGVEFGCWTKDEGAVFLTGWNNLLLPGCCPYHNIPLEIPGRTIIPEYDCEELFQQTLQSMLTVENWIHFVYVPPESSFQTEKNGIEIWGYIRVYQDRKSHQRILTLQIREELFRALAKRFSTITCDWYEILKHLRQKGPAYLHPSKTTRMPGIGPGEKTLILKADQLVFLPCEIHSMILSAYLLHKPPTKSESNH